METQLRTVPSFTFYQEGEDIEMPVNITYWNGTICLEQNGEEVHLLPECVEKLFKAIKKHRPEAEEVLRRRYE